MFSNDVTVMEVVELRVIKIVIDDSCDNYAQVAAIVTSLIDVDCTDYH